MTVCVVRWREWYWGAMEGTVWNFGVRFVVAVGGLLDSSGIFSCVVESVVELLRFSYDAEIVW